MGSKKTQVIALRLGNEVIERLRQKAEGLPLAEYIKGVIMESVNTKPESVNTESNQFPTPKQEKLTELRGIIANSDAPQSKSRPLKEESNSRVPLYNAEIHKAGDRVRVWQGDRVVEVIVPDFDADGHPVPVF